MKTTFNDFLNEQYKLIIEPEITDDFQMDEINWELECNITDIWNQYKEDKNENQFLKKYKQKLLEQKDKLIQIDRSCWNDLVDILNEKKLDDILPYLNKIYDWADKYGIKIISNKNV